MPRGRKKSLSACTSQRLSREGSEESSTADDAPKVKDSRLENGEASESVSAHSMDSTAADPPPSTRSPAKGRGPTIKDYFQAAQKPLRQPESPPPKAVLLTSIDDRALSNRADDQASDRSEGDSGKENDEDHERQTNPNAHHSHRPKAPLTGKHVEDNTRVMTRSQLRSKKAPLLSLAHETVRLNPTSTPPPSPSKMMVGTTPNPASPPTPHKIQLLEGKSAPSKTNCVSSGSTNCSSTYTCSSNSPTKAMISASALQKLRLTLSPKTKKNEPNDGVATQPSSSSHQEPESHYHHQPSMFSPLKASGDHSDRTSASQTSGTQTEAMPSIVTSTKNTARPTAANKKSKAAAHAANSSHKMTEYFHIRRSNRKSKTTLEKEQLQEIEHHLLADDDNECDVAVEVFPEKGRGVVALKHFEKGEFVVEYAGDLIDIGSAKERESKYSLDLSTGCYMYYFKYNNHNYCIDATSESGRLGRLVNHSRLTPNLQTKVVSFKNMPRLILVARTEIPSGTELLYDYGDRSKESLEAHPWLAY
ncbi:hypothetical protein TCAL_01201 [Tigriopus californicus]|uniref:[histone H4]-lysine(20) N-methyltransferase n=1 Tax=Tigriopus californicus TaxID=6832 RepID=A0A553NXN3_TIGCA|nr:N-lysine methyltransferase KMT5A-A-like [Tigriopus californicus]TRY70195.1 hypothetical protein TCAL_01201 [Tigriopus californicus]|eukprot:TCALIF_01201-PA protein Name:"Similar to pr-set7 Histone-lysine N-methyltransferase pr-set7 (Drosophila melanogaster)" AED:0.02 eAED:0.02 QI:440/1/1/1/0.75/0.8/5/1266/532